MKLVYDITIEDLVVFNIYCYEHSTVRRRRLRVYRLITPILFLTLVLYLSFHVKDPAVFIVIELAVGIPAYLLWIYRYPKLVRKRIRNYIQNTYKKEKDTLALGKQELLVTSEGITETSTNGETKTRWAGIQNIAQTDLYIFIFTGPSRGYIIPKRTFTDVQNELEFVNALNKFDGNSN